MNRYELLAFVEKQNQELSDYLKTVGLIPSVSSFTPTWNTQEYFDCKNLTNLRLTIEFVKK